MNFSFQFRNITALEKRWIAKIKLKFPSLARTPSDVKNQSRPVSRHDDIHLSSDDDTAATLTMRQLSKSLLNSTLIDHRNCSAGDF